MAANYFNDSSSSSSSSSDNDEYEDILLNIIISEMKNDRPKNEDFVEVTVPLYTDQQFLEHFRISRQNLDFLTSRFEISEFYPKTDTGCPRISPKMSMLIFLWYAGHEAGSFRDIGDRFNISLSTLHGVIENVSLFLSGLSSSIILWPTDQEKLEILEDFNRMGFPGALGCMDGTHIRIDTPSHDPDSYLNRKKYFSLQAQVVCDSKRKIRDVFIGYPGSVHDSRVFRNSPLFDTIGEKCGDHFILADSAYPCLRNVLTPYRNTGNLTPVEVNYNKKLSHCRVLIEHTFGILKQKFRQLYHIKLRKIEMICHFFRACCVLHNFSIDDELSMEEGTGDNEQVIELVENENEDGNDANPAGTAYRNYIASILNI